MRIAYTLVLGGLLLAGCGGDAGRTTSADRGAGPRAGVYEGVFPCADCPGIEATLWLRDDGRFFMKRGYLDGETVELEAYNSGRWRWSGVDGELVLDGAGPDRRLTHPDPDRLELVTHSPEPHVLSRVEPARRFVERFEVEGLAKRAGDAYLVTQCATGLEAPVERSGDFVAFRRQFDSLAARGGVVYVEFEGRFDWSSSGAPETLHIDRFLTIDPDRGC